MVKMKNRKALITLIKKEIKTFMSQHNFSFIKPTILFRNKDNILHIINFDVHAPGFNCNIAIQPLYIPNDNIDLSFGNRLNHFKTKLPGIWGYGDSSQDEKDLKEVIGLLEINVLPWFEEVGTPEGIIRFLKYEWEKSKSLIVGFPPYLKFLYTGFSYMYISNLKLGKFELENFLNELRNDSRTWVVDLKKKVETILSMENEEQVKQLLISYCEWTKNNLKIK